MKIYTKKFHQNFFEKILKNIVNRLNQKWARKYHKDGYPQLAIFSHDYLGISVNSDGIYEGELLKFIFNWLSSFKKNMKSSTVLDIGANIGNHSIFFSNYFSKVISFEPNPRTYKLLEFNCSALDNVECRMIGISNNQSEGYILEDPKNIGGSNVQRAKERPQDIGKIKRKIFLDTLDSVTKNITNVFLIKIDVEGFELDVLEGGKKFFSKNKPIVLFEQHEDDFINGKSVVVDFFITRGYSIAILEKRFANSNSFIINFFGYLLRCILGEKYNLKIVSIVPPRLHPLIIAIPEKYSN